MKKLLAMSLACSFLTMSVSFAADEGDYSTRTLRARHALTTGSPGYADRDMEDDNDVRREDRANRTENQFDAEERMEERDQDWVDESEFRGDDLNDSRTYKSRRAIDTGDSY
ncbi:MAG TPA: hypothetical protein VNJ08_14985 [Bacteriovoracaceae bacterium]|nr:hypothetical protein [Bacteriovoracaceae bacterium]